MDLVWRKCQGDIWCNFRTLQIDNPVFNDAIGVYIIWSSGTTVKVGIGNIRSGIFNDRMNQQILSFPNSKVTWCLASPPHLNGIKRFLIERLRPVIFDVIIDAPIEVNLPW